MSLSRTRSDQKGHVAYPISVLGKGGREVPGAREGCKGNNAYLKTYNGGGWGRI